MTQRVRARIDLSALQHNLQRVRACAPASRVMAVLKANAYGHSLSVIAQALAERVDAIGVARCDEALALRAQGLQLPLVLLQGFSGVDELRLAARHGLESVIHHDTQLDMLEQAEVDYPGAVWLKIDTGMHRLGFAPAAVDTALRRLRACQLRQPVRLMTHLACADDRDSTYTDNQVETFRATTAKVPGARSIANSAGILAWPTTHADWVRPGIMLYGISPFPGTVAVDFGLAPVMTLTTRLIAINHFTAGSTVGYGGTWRCPHDMPIGVAAAGYGDGYPRHATPGTPVLVRGQRAALVGRVCMDMICVDLSRVPEAQVGDRVELWGAGLPVEEIAARASTIAYELVCSVSARVKLDVVAAPVDATAAESINDR